MNLFSLLFIIILLTNVSHMPSVDAFSTGTPKISLHRTTEKRTVHAMNRDSNSDAVKQAERLRAKVAQLRQQAAEQEKAVRSSILHKQTQRQEQTDALIDQLFNDNTNSVVENLRRKRPSMDTLMNVVERLDERQAQAQGAETVEARLQQNDSTEEIQFCRSSGTVDPDETLRIEHQLDQLLGAAAILDQDYAEQRSSKQLHSTKVEHFGGGTCAAQLETRLHELRRERSDHYRKRVEELREATRLKDDDDHKFHGYHDMGTLN